MNLKLTQNLVSQSVSQSVRQTDRHSLVDSKSCVKSEIAVGIC